MRNVLIVVELRFDVIRDADRYPPCHTQRHKYHVLDAETLEEIANVPGDALFTRLDGTVRLKPDGLAIATRTKAEWKTIGVPRVTRAAVFAPHPLCIWG